MLTFVPKMLNRESMDIFEDEYLPSKKLMVFSWAPSVSIFGAGPTLE
jgi:hypothetical protein